jgi:hypothetical protein
MNDYGCVQDSNVHATPTDKLARLRSALAYPLELANAILLRETQKKAQNIWSLRKKKSSLFSRFFSWTPQAMLGHYRPPDHKRKLQAES